MSTEENKAVFRRFVQDVLNAGNVAAFDEVTTPGFVEHEELPPGVPAGREGSKMFLSMFLSAFPDLNVTIEDEVAEGDRVVARTTWRGTHQGEFMGVPPTGKQVEFKAIDIVQVEGGKASEHWGVTDTMTLMQQLGAIPAPGEG